MAPKVEIDPHALRTARNYIYDAIREGLQSARPSLSDEDQRRAIETAFDQIERAIAVFEAYPETDRAMIGLLMNHFRAILYDLEEDEGGTITVRWVHAVHRDTIRGRRAALHSVASRHARADS